MKGNKQYFVHMLVAVKVDGASNYSRETTTYYCACGENFQDNIASLMKHIETENV